MFSTTSSWNDVPAAAPPFFAVRRKASVAHVGAPPACAVDGDGVGDVVGVASVVGDATAGDVGAAEVGDAVVELTGEDGPELPVQPAAAPSDATTTQTVTSGRTQRA